MADTRFLLILCLYFLHHGIQPTGSAKIIAYPMFAGSQYIGMKRIAEELVSRGHEVTILVSSVQKIKPSKGIKYSVYKVPFQEGFVEKVMANKIIKEGVVKTIMSSSNSVQEVLQIFCEALLNDTKLLDSLIKRNFDVIITDTSMFCGPVIADYLDIRRVEYCPAPPRFTSLFTPYQSIFTISYVPLMMSRNPSRMNFLQRTKNSLIYLLSCLAFRIFVARRFEQLKQNFNVKMHRSYMESMTDKDLTLYLGDFALDYPHPILPNQKMIGPLNVQPVKPLPPDLQQLIDSSGEDGFIIVSFGSNVASVLDKEKVDIMAEAFGRLKQKVIWRLQGYIPSILNPKIKTVEWLPQNDLLAHPKLRVFVSHCGLNSVYEAAFRGVPVVALPLYGDQFDNAGLLKERGLGLSLDYQTLTADEMYNTIERVIQQPRFRENAKRISGLLSDRPRSPAQEAADWIEYTIRHGGLAHLRPSSSQLAWYQYFLVDVVLFLVLIVFVVILLIKYTVRLFCWLCCRSRQQKVKTQ